MIGFLRLTVFGFIALSVLYLVIWLYARSVRREKLEHQWAEKHSGTPDEREAFLDEGMARYEHSLKRRLLWLVYLIPMALLWGFLIWNNSY